jgi:site-specific DNA-methyltransferase (cytosine-N4-specific)
MVNKLETSWDFKEANTKEFTHGLHTYPAMMIPQIARKLFDLYGNDAEVVLDPFCGSGTSLVEATLRKNIKKAYGIDINPLARHITKVKTTPLDERMLNKTLLNILNFKDINTTEIKNPLVFNLAFWFKPKIIIELNLIKNSIGNINDKDIKDFFMICFSELVRKVSNTRNGEFKLYRMNEKRMNKHNPNVIKEFENISKKNIMNISEYINSNPQNNTIILAEDTRRRTSIPNETVDLIITSPPYGDSKTTVAYGQFSRLSLEWLGYPHKETTAIDKVSLGGISIKSLGLELSSTTLIKIIRKLSNIDIKRAKEVLSFYLDFDKCINELDRTMKKNGYICFVVGNRTVKGMTIPTDNIMIEMFLARGNYKHIKTYYRNIPFKRMPLLNSPTNIKGIKSSTMNKESIFILQKV